MRVKAGYLLFAVCVVLFIAVKNLYYSGTVSKVPRADMAPQQYKAGDRGPVPIPDPVTVDALNHHHDTGGMLDIKPVEDKVVLKSEHIGSCSFCDVFDFNKPSDTSLDTGCVTLASSPATKICLYPSEQDIYISKSIRFSGMWEANEVAKFQQYLRKHENMGVIDIGCNIGVYTLSAAKMGRAVVAVEPNDDHVKRVHRAVNIERLEPFVTLLDNAVGDIRGKVKVKKHRDNQGASEVQQLGTEMRSVNESVDIVNTIIMDDIVQFCDFTEAIMKIDIEGFEHKALAHADTLFDRVHVPVVMMEWAAMVRFASQPADSFDRTLVMHMIDFFKGRRYTPVDWYDNNLQLEKWASWPRDIIWVLDNTTFL